MGNIDFDDGDYDDGFEMIDENAYIREICADEVNKSFYAKTKTKCGEESACHWREWIPKAQANSRKTMSLIGDCIREKYKNINDQSLQQEIQRRMVETEALAERWKSMNND